jgi:hypothetical protein
MSLESSIDNLTLAIRDLAETQRKVLQELATPRVEVTAAPIETSVQAPKKPVKAKKAVETVETVELPVETVELPVETVELPVETVELPVETVELPVETVAIDENPVKTVTLDEPATIWQVKQLATDIMRRSPDARPRIQALLRKYGAAKTNDLLSRDLPDFYEELQQLDNADQEI